MDHPNEQIAGFMISNEYDKTLFPINVFHDPEAAFQQFFKWVEHLRELGFFETADAITGFPGMPIRIEIFKIQILN